MQNWIGEFLRSWRDKNFMCAMVGFLLSYAAIIIMGLLLPLKIFVTILGAIAGWQLASWSWELAPKIKKLLFKD